MGKIRNKRHAYHTSAPKLEGEEIASTSQVQSTEESLFDNDITITKSPFPNNIFGNVSITPDMLKQRLETAAPTRRDKRKARQALKRKEYSSLQVEFKEMLQANKKLKKKDRPSVNSVFKDTCVNVERKNELKKRTGVTHLESLMDALPSVKRVKVDKSSTKRKPRIAKPSKTQAKEMSNDMNTFLEIMKNPTFASDPFSTISNHLKRKLEAERQDT